MSHNVRPDRVYRTSVIQSTQGYSPVQDMMAVAQRFTQPLGAANGGFFRGLLSRVRAWRMRLQAEQTAALQARYGSGAPQAPIAGAYAGFGDAGKYGYGQGPTDRMSTVVNQIIAQGVATGGASGAPTWDPALRAANAMDGNSIAYGLIAQPASAMGGTPSADAGTNAAMARFNAERRWR